MSDCHKARDLYSFVLEQEASAYDQKFFDGHLSECSGCRQEWLDVKATQNLIAGLPRIAVSASFEDRVMAGVRQAVRDSRPAPVWSPAEPEMRWWQGWLPRFGLVGAAAGLVALVSSPTIRSVFTAPGTFTGGAVATVEPAVQRLEDRFPDLPPEVLRSLDEESYVLDRMTVRPGTSGGMSRVVAPVDYESGGTVYVTF